MPLQHGAQRRAEAVEPPVEDVTARADQAAPKGAELGRGTHTHTHMTQSARTPPKPPPPPRASHAARGRQRDTGGWSDGRAGWSPTHPRVPSLTAWGRGGRVGGRGGSSPPSSSLSSLDTRLPALGRGKGNTPVPPSAEAAGVSSGSLSEESRALHHRGGVGVVRDFLGCPIWGVSSTPTTRMPGSSPGERAVGVGWLGSAGRGAGGAGGGLWQ